MNTTFTHPTNEVLKTYDALIYATLANLYGLGKDEKTIRLWNFDRKNKEHLYILRIALMARDLYGYKIQIATSWWNGFLLNRKIRKNFEKIEIINELYINGSILTQDLIKFMRKAGQAELGKDFSFADIYDEYYEGSLN